jgi:SAM-dependent methyltransferase
MKLSIVIVSITFVVYWLYRRFIRPWYANREFRAWRKRPHIKQTLQVLQRIYQGVNAFSLAKAAWQQPKFRDYAFIYGEIDIVSFIALLEACEPKAGGVFYDLGSGSGKAVFTAALAFDFKLCRGVELIPELYALSLRLQQQMPELAGKVEFIHGDFLAINFSEADLVFVNAACFLGETWHKLLAKLQALQPGAKVIIGAKELPATHFRLLHTSLRHMSWGAAKVSLYQRYS